VKKVFILKLPGFSAFQLLKFPVSQHPNFSFSNLLSLGGPKSLIHGKRDKMTEK
jgi:hypothetical protein